MSTVPEEEEEEEPAPVEEPSPAHKMVGIVDITPVQSDPRARRVARTLRWYFESINRGEYTRAADALVSHQAPHDPTTQDSQVVIRRLYYRGGQFVATVTFTSHQAPRWAPDGVSRCVNWRLTYPIEHSSNFLPYQLGHPIHGSQPYRPCGF